MNYKGYRASVAFEEDSDVFFGRLVGIPDIIVFEAETIDELKAAFHEAVYDYLQHCEKIGKEPKSTIPES